MTRLTSRTGPGNSATNSQQVVALRQSKQVLHLLDTEVQTECKYRPQPLLGPDGHAIFVHALLHSVHPTHCFFIMFDKKRLTMSVLFASDLDHLFADCNEYTPTSFETVLTTLLSFHRTTTIPFLVSVAKSKDPLVGFSIFHRFEWSITKPV